MSSFREPPLRGVIRVPKPLSPTQQRIQGKYRSPGLGSAANAGAYLASVGLAGKYPQVMTALSQIANGQSASAFPPAPPAGGAGGGGAGGGGAGGGGAGGGGGRPAVPSDLPLDSQAMNEIGAARNQLTDTTAGLDRQGKEALDSYGYAGTFDPNGVLSGVGEVNYANPFSRASLLKRSYDQGVRGNTNRMAARGQLYAGSLVNAQNDTLWNRQRGEDANVRGLQSLIGGLLSRRQQANTAFGRAEISARGSNMARWIGRLDNGS